MPKAPCPFLGAPDRPAFWRALLDNGVDLINTDDLDGGAKFCWSTDIR